MASLINNYVFKTLSTLIVGWDTVLISPDLEQWNVVSFTNARLVFTNSDMTIVERVAWSASAGTLTLTKRWLIQWDTDTEDSSLEKERLEWTTVYVTVLASQIADKQNDNTRSGKNTFDELEVTEKLEIPRYADATARNTAIPSPNRKMIVVTGDVVQHYNETTEQREDLDVGTPPPPASETASWIIEIATDAETTIGTDDTRAITPKKLQKKVDDLVLEWVPTDALVERSMFMLWEDCVKNELLFLEWQATYSLSNTPLNIWDTSTNTRRAFRVLLTDEFVSSFNVAIRKVLSPSAALNFRLETDSSWPTWVLYHANATATIAAASVTTSKVDTNINWAWTFTTSEWDIARLVVYQWTYWSETVNWTNYFQIYTEETHTTTRWSLRWNWSAYSKDQTSETLSSWVTYNTTTSTTVSYWVAITTSKIWTVTTVTKNASCNATRCVISTKEWSEIYTTSFSWNTATFNKLLAPWDYNITCDSNWSSYNSRFNSVATTFPKIGTNLSITSWISIWTSWIWVISTQTINIENISFVTDMSVYKTYISSSMFSDSLLSKADAIFPYKLPSDYRRVASSSWSTWDKIDCIKFWYVSWLSWLVSWSIYFAWNTAWSISATPWLYPYQVWIAINSEGIDIRPYQWAANTPALSLSNSQPNISKTSYTYLSPNSSVLLFNIIASCTWSSSSTTVWIEYSTDWSTWYVYDNVTANETTLRYMKIVEMSKWLYYRTYITRNSNCTWWTSSISLSYIKSL